MKNLVVVLCVLFSVFLGGAVLSDVFAANIYVDKDHECTSNSYDAEARDCNGSDGNSYTTIQLAIDDMTAGDHIILRGGTYQPDPSTTECINIPLSKNGTSWEEGDYNKISSYQGEWAVIDGQNDCGTRGMVIGHYEADHTTDYNIKYWMFERIEIKNGSTSDDYYSGGFFGNGGPFKFRYCYIHDNVATGGDGNPAGLKGYHWQNSLVEWCYFDNNGMATGTNNIPCHILFMSDYDGNNIAENGYDDESTLQHVKGNTIRYNYFTNGSNGIKIKTTQLLTGRNVSGGEPYDDTYKTLGDKVHHNIFEGVRRFAIAAHQDFGQIYNNIIRGGYYGIVSAQENAWPALYKVCIYNNTLQDQTRNAIMRLKYMYWLGTFTEEDTYWGYDYNNIIDNGGSTGACSGTTEEFTVCPDGSPCGNMTFDLTNYINSNNYFYQPINDDLYRMKDTLYTAAEFEAQELTSAPREVYENDYDDEDLLYKGTTGADQYKTNATHVLEDSITIEDGGIDEAHPYLSGVTIPSYVGATEPDHDSWVDMVLDLENLPTANPLCQHYRVKYENCLELEATGSERDPAVCNAITDSEDCGDANCTWNPQGLPAPGACVLDLCLADMDFSGRVTGSDLTVLKRDLGRTTNCECDDLSGNICDTYAELYSCCMNLIDGGSNLDLADCLSYANQTDCNNTNCYWNDQGLPAPGVCIVDICLADTDFSGRVTGADLTLLKRDLGRVANCP